MQIFCNPCLIRSPRQTSLMLLLSQKKMQLLVKGYLLMKKTEKMQMKHSVFWCVGAVFLFCYLCANHSRQFHLSEIVRQNKRTLNLSGVLTLPWQDFHT